jgi:hypothetical protein
MLRQNRFVHAGIEAGKVTVQVAGKAARKLWLEVTGFLFAVFAAVGGAATIRQYLQEGETLRVALGVLFTAVFTYFSVSSFLSSRRSH